MAGVDQVEFSTASNPVIREKTPIPISTIPDNTRRKLQKL
jgi:hypothetical protein